jgi:TfoX/Sxy family transcriptional regulator of competence genes
MPREMPKFEKSPPELVSRFNAVLDAHAAPDVTRRPMFGYPCAWINGNMATGLFAKQWWLRLADADREELLAMPGAHPFEVMPGKAMGAYVTMPDDVVADDARLGDWIDRALTFTRTVPPKKQ